MVRTVHRALNGFSSKVGGVVIGGILLAIFTLIVTQIRHNVRDIRDLDHRVDILERGLSPKAHKAQAVPSDD
jgi:hypothetical protein